MMQRRKRQPAGANVPHARDPISASCRHQAAIGAEPRVINCALMAKFYWHAVAHSILKIIEHPHPGDVILAGCQEMKAVRAECHFICCTNMRYPIMLLRSLPSIPQA